jgi:hypothetical protein
VNAAGAFSCIRCRMARFFFDLAVDGLEKPDDEGLDCFDASAIQAEAARTAAEMLKDRPPRDGSVTIVVRDETGRPLFKVAASLQIQALGQPSGDPYPSIVLRAISA